MLPTDTTFNSAVASYLDVSTCHISKSDNDILEHLCNPDTICYWEVPIIVEKHGFGFWVHVNEDVVNYFKAGEVDKLANESGLSVAFYLIIARAYEHNCTWVKFDCDAGVIEGLQQFDW